ncbi:hypothetical protein BA899_01250 [Spiribacter sp. SSL99]|nr:hypothetical protein BA899_01250 [Spiribacter sp. SSL99]
MISGGKDRMDLNRLIRTISGGKDRMDLNRLIRTITGGKDRMDLNRPIKTISGGKDRMDPSRPIRMISGVRAPMDLSRPMKTTTGDKGHCSRWSSHNPQGEKFERVARSATGGFADRAPVCWVYLTRSGMAPLVLPSAKSALTS